MIAAAEYRGTSAHAIVTDTARLSSRSANNTYAVEHLVHVYDKLGLGSRAELALAATARRINGATVST